MNSGEESALPMVSSSSSASNKYEGTASLDCSWKKISVVSEWWKSSGMLGSQPVFSAKVPDSSFGGVPVVYCPDDDHMEEEVQLKVQVEEEKIGETHGKEKGEEQRVKERTTLRRTTWMTMQMR